MSKQNSVIRRLVTRALTNLLDLMTVAIVLLAGLSGYGYGNLRDEHNALLWAAVGIVVGIFISALLLGVVYLIVEIAEQTKAIADNTLLLLERMEVYAKSYDGRLPPPPPSEKERVPPEPRGKSWQDLPAFRPLPLDRKIAREPERPLSKVRHWFGLP